eukprot:TRINITY_DN47085_c0_g1_i1.p1 TRINITY_DN47085_c0_g1~~TRINITY_DN47085_c0_g1_i1.p1  ORF type:complete len:242 (+),score=15.01 TRINITY_DN47085_c0_g1_i1:69-794(+)
MTPSSKRSYVVWICIELMFIVLPVSVCSRTRVISNRAEVAIGICCCKATPCHGKWNPLQKQHFISGVFYCCQIVEANILGGCPFSWDDQYIISGESACPPPTASSVVRGRNNSHGENILEERMSKLRGENVVLHARYLYGGSWRCVPLQDWQEPLVSKLLATDFDHDIGGDSRWEETMNWNDSHGFKDVNNVHYFSSTNTYRMMKDIGKNYHVHTLYVDSLCKEQLTPEWGREFFQTVSSV